MVSPCQLDLQMGNCFRELLLIYNQKIHIVALPHSVKRSVYCYKHEKLLHNGYH